MFKIKFQSGTNSVAQQTIIPKDERIKMAEQERQSYLNFMQHPSYKKRLLMEMFGKEANPKNVKQQKALEEEYLQRVGTIEKIPIKFKKLPYLGQTIPGENEAKKILLSEEGVMATNPEQFQDVIRHEMGHAVNNAIVGRGGNMRNPVQKIMIQQSKPGRKAMSELMTQWSSDEKMWDKGEKQKFIQQATKEFGSDKVQKVLKLRKDADDEMLNNSLKMLVGAYKPKIDEWSEFNKILDKETFDFLYQSPTEAASRLSNIRRIAADKFGHDLNEDFDIKKYGPQVEEFYKQKNVKSPLEDLKQQGFSDEAINEMMKYIARNSKKKNEYQAKRGIKFVK